MPAWRPVTDTVDGDLLASKFDGTPYLPDDVWPICPTCNEPMQLFLQLNRATLPESSKAYASDGMIQLFYCIGSEAEDMCEASIENYEPFSPGQVCRLIEILPDSAPTPSLPANFEPFESKRIIRWDEFPDHPGFEAFERLGLLFKFRNDRKTLSATAEWADGNVRVENLRRPRFKSFDTDLTAFVSKAEDKDKLGGWPYWIQGEEYPNCSTCGESMNYLFQIDSEDHLDFMFGDMGCGRLFQCPKHADILTFTWDCG